MAERHPDHEDDSFIPYALGFLDSKSGSPSLSEDEQEIYREIANLLRRLSDSNV